MLRNMNETFFNDARDQIKDLERLHRKALYLGNSSRPINKRQFKQYNGECVDTQFKGLLITLFQWSLRAHFHRC